MQAHGFPVFNLLYTGLLTVRSAGTQTHRSR